MTLVHMWTCIEMSRPSRRGEDEDDLIYEEDEEDESPSYGKNTRRGNVSRSSNARRHAQEADLHLSNFGNVFQYSDNEGRRRFNHAPALGEGLYYCWIPQSKQFELPELPTASAATLVLTSHVKPGTFVYLIVEEMVRSNRYQTCCVIKANLSYSL